MATWDQYASQPLGGLDVGAKLTQVLEAGRQQARRQEWESTASDIIQSGDPSKISQLMVKFPEMTGTIEKAMGLSPRSADGLAGMARDILTSGEFDPARMHSILQEMQSRGENITGPVTSLQKMMQDPSYAQEWAKKTLAWKDPKGLEAFMKATGTEKEDLTTKEQEYMRAVAEGYQGNFMQYQTDLKKAGAAKTTTNIQNVLGDKVVEELGKKQAAELVTRREEAIGTVRSLSNMQEMANLLDSGIITGTGAQFLTSVGNALSSRLGINFAEDSVANTQAYAAAAGRQVAEVIKAFGSGTGLSDQDRAYAEGIAGGKIEFNEKALRKLIQLNEKYSRMGLEAYNRDAKKAEERVKESGGTLLYDLTVEMPGPIKIGGQQNIEQMSDEELLQNLGL